MKRGLALCLMLIAAPAGAESIVAGLSQNRVSHLELHADELSVKQLLGWCAVLGLEPVL